MAELLVDTAAVCRNYHHYARQGMVIPVLKKDGYGLGAQVLRTLLAQQGAGLFACATAEEALALAGRGSDILLLSCEYDPVLLRQLVKKRVILALESLEQVSLLPETPQPVRVHLAVDTGFGRFGFSWRDTEQMRQVFEKKNVKVEGIFSHFRSAEAAKVQFKRFQTVLDALADKPVGLRHIAATACAHIPAYRLDAVRIGTGLTGCADGTFPVSRLAGRICTIHTLEKGSRISYGNTRLKRDTRVAIVEMGTGDGAFCRPGCGLRSWWRSRHESVAVNDCQAPVLGVPGMTHTAIDVTDIPCRIGDLAFTQQSPVRVADRVLRRYTACYFGMTGLLAR